MRLGEVSRIKVGLVLTRKKAEFGYEVKARYRLLTLKNINFDGTFTNEPYEEFESNDELDGEHFTQEGNVLIRLSHPNTAIYIEREQEGLLIPSYFARIKVNHPDFIPGFIAWYLNTDRVKNELLKFQAGTNIPSTNKNVLEQIHIPEVDIEKQRLITHIQSLHYQETRLYQKLIEEKRKMNKLATYSIASIH